jgi:hypothetical protein
MEDPVSIPVQDLTAQPEPPGADSVARSAAEEVAQRIVEVITIGASGMVALLDDVNDEELRDLAAAAAGFAIEGTRALGSVARAIERSLAAPAAAAGRSPFVGDLLAHWEAIWEQEEAADRPTVDESLRRAVDAVLNRIDLTEVIRSHVDIQRIARDIDVNALVADLDVNTLVADLDMQALTDRIDVEALAAKIDVDAIAGRLDLDALVRRLDILAIATEVIDELDLAQLIRDATADTASDGVRSVRLRGVDADRAVRRAVDKILARHNGSDTG